MGKLTESRRRISTAIISAPSTLAKSDWFWAGDYRCEQNSPHYEPHTNSSCYEEATFAEANSDKQDYTTSPRLARLVLTFHPRVLRPRTRLPIIERISFAFSGRHNSANGPILRACASTWGGCHSQQTIPTKSDCLKKILKSYSTQIVMEFWEISQLVRTYSETERLFSFLFAFDFFST